MSSPTVKRELRSPTDISDRCQGQNPYQNTSKSVTGAALGDQKLITSLRERIRQLEFDNEMLSYENRQLQRRLRFHHWTSKNTSEPVPLQVAESSQVPPPQQLPRYSRAYSTPYSLPAGALSPPRAHPSTSNFVSNRMPLKVLGVTQEQPVAPVQYYYDSDTTPPASPQRKASPAPSEAPSASISLQNYSQIDAESNDEGQSVADEPDDEYQGSCQDNHEVDDDEQADDDFDDDFNDY
ncbi:hypothetical protein DM02DRAFT_307618 [Periconia macrospinosa]|uniref:Uncharacterized protein n=1 Tax=Periconia macrospinosa TaxID=97972 RepID=A0A2V1D1T1_9PLEO|nr:hypothetical protein DM02DRAFT_307618 [Periconia macrospinosa]